MTANLRAVRAIVIRSCAVVAVLVTYALGNIGAQVATAVGVSTLALTTSATSARAGWGWRRRGWYGWGWRRGGWGRCPWGEWC